MGRWEIARVAAWDTFGRRYWRWFVFGPMAARGLGLLIVAGGLLVAARYVALNVGGWLAWLSLMASGYLLPMVLVAVGVTLYAIVAVVFWRLNGWKWKFNGFTTVRYTFCVMLLLVASTTVIGVSL